MRHTAVAAALVLAGATPLFAGKPRPAPAPYVLESATLRLEVLPAYAYKVIEKSSGTVLVSQNLTTFTLGSSSYNALALSGVALGTGTLDGTLTLSGSKQTAHVQFAFASADDLQITLTSNGTAPVAIAERFADVGQRYYGVWENALPNGLDNRGVSAGYDGKELTTTKDVFAASARAPFFLTNRNYGIHTNTQAQGTYTFAQAGNTTVKFNAPSLQYDILHGTTPKAILAQHNRVAGPAFMPPDWAFDTIFWRDDFHQLPAANPAITNAQQLILDDSAKLQAAGIHAGAMWIDRPYGTGSANQDANVGGWGNMDFDTSFPDPSQMAQTLHDQGINLLLWAANKANNNLKTEGAAAGYLFTGYSSSPGIDLRNAAAYAWFQGQLNTLDNQARLADGTTGIKGFKLDRGGEGEIPDALINAETTLFQKLAYENMQARSPGDAFLFTRNINGQGRQYAAVWSGDPKTTWLGFQTSIKNGLRSGLINFPLWGSDTGGYAGAAPSQELFARWVAFSAYSPMMEIIQGPGRNLFYDYSPQTLAIAKKYTDLHHDLIPYTRASLATALATGTPIMRPMFVEFPNEPSLADNSDQYMYGPNLLVAPLTTAGATARSVYLPALPNNGQWLDYNDRHTLYAGARSITAAAALAVIPTFVREGAIIPRGDIVRGNNRATDWRPSLHIEVFASATTPATFDYYTGSATVTLFAAPGPNGFEVTCDDLALPGSFDLYLTEPSGVTLNGLELLAGTGYTYDPSAYLLSVAFTTGPITLDIFGARSLFDGLPLGAAAQDFSSAVPVPEPASLAGLALGVVSLLARRRPRA